MEIAGYSFDGPFPLSLPLSPIQYADKHGVYIVARMGGSAPEYLDVDYASPIGEHLSNHPRQGCWTERAAGSPLALYVHEDAGSEGGQMQVSLRVREEVTLPCG